MQLDKFCQDNKNVQLCSQFPHSVKTATAVRVYIKKNTLANYKSVCFQYTNTFFKYYCSHNTGNKLLYLQVPCQASVVVISALETCLAVKFKKKKVLQNQCLH